jgi:hypothetical protein
VRVFAIAIAALFAAVAVVSLLAGRDNPRAGSSENDGPAVKITSIPTTYTATFRIENRADKKKPVVVTTERYWVRRPFDSRVETWRGDTRLSTRWSNFGVLAQESTDAQPLNIGVPPSLATGDLRVDAALGEAVRDRVVIRRERRKVYGRLCQVYRAGGPVSAGSLEPYKAGLGEFADFCVDRHGLVIEEAWTSRGRLILRRVAEKLAIDPPLSDDVFHIGVPRSAASLQGAIKRITPTKPRWVIPHPPSGFRSLGVYTVTVPSIAVPQQPGGAPGVGPVSTTEVFVNGPDLLVVDQDPSLADYVKSDKRPARSADLGPLRDGRLVIDARLNEARGATSDGSFVRLLGTLSPSELAPLARSMVKR